MGGALIDRLGGGAGDAVHYRLEVGSMTTFRLRHPLDNAVTRERQTLRARYGWSTRPRHILIDANAGSDAGIDVVSSNMRRGGRADRARAASVEVADQIVSRIALCVSNGHAQDRRSEGEQGPDRQSAEGRARLASSS